MKLSGKVALITGAGSGIGRAIALTFAAEGADVAVNDLNLSSAEKTAEEVKLIGRRSIAVEADVSDDADVGVMVERTLRELGSVDILVNNAGTGPEMVPTTEQSIDKFDRVVRTNLYGTYFCCRRVGKLMVNQKAGKIVNISSMTGVLGFPMRNSYSASKAAIINLTKALAVEWAQYNINVNCIAPGYILTPLLESAINEGLIDKEPVIRRTPLGRMGNPEDVANAALFLVSEEANFITGVTLPVDGGWLTDGVHNK